MLNQIKSPADLKSLTPEQIQQLEVKLEHF